MHDLPSVTLLQQSHAIPKSGEELEVLGKSASRMYSAGRCGTLNEAVVETVKHAGLSPEQVKRVIEFANTNAYLTEFNKEGGSHKYVEFQGGPASPAEVLRDLNDGGGGSVFDRGLADYSHDPQPEKTAAVRIGGPSMMDIAGDMASSASRRYEMPAYEGYDPFGETQKKMQVRMLSAMTGRQPVVVKHAAVPMDPGLMMQQPSLADETRGMLGATGGEAAATPPVGDPNAAPGEAPPAAPGEVQAQEQAAGYDPLPEHMKLMQQHMKLMQQRAGTQAAPTAAPVDAGMGPKLAGLLDFDPAETMFEQAFGVVEEPIPYAEPWNDSLELRDKLAGAADHLTSELSFLEGEFQDALDNVYHEVKVAALEGVELGQVLAAWQHVVPDSDYVKTAFLHIGPRLQEEGVFPSLDAIGASLEKTAHVGMLNEEHPLVGSMAGYCLALDKLAELRVARDELLQERNRLDYFLKEAGALLPKAISAARAGLSRAGEAVGSGAETVAAKLLTDNPETARAIGNAARTATEYGVPGVGGLLAYNELSARAKVSPGYQKTKDFVAARVLPGSLAARERMARLAQRGGY